MLRLLLCSIVAAFVVGVASPQGNIVFHGETDTLQLHDVTTYAPRPTTSMPQSQLRSLCVTPRGKFPHPLDCRKYVDCWDGRVLEKRCPNDLVFSDLPGEFCDYLEYVDCASRPVLLDNNEQVVGGHSDNNIQYQPLPGNSNG